MKIKVGHRTKELTKNKRKYFADKISDNRTKYPQMKYWSSIYLQIKLNEKYTIILRGSGERCSVNGNNFVFL